MFVSADCCGPFVCFCGLLWTFRLFLRTAVGLVFVSVDCCWLLLTFALFLWTAVDLVFISAPRPLHTTPHSPLYLLRSTSFLPTTALLTETDSLTHSHQSTRPTQLTSHAQCAHPHLHTCVQAPSCNRTDHAHATIHMQVAVSSTMHTSQKNNDNDNN